MPFTQEQFINHYNTKRPETGISCQHDAQFALNKLTEIKNNIIRLSPEQKVQLEKLANKSDEVDWTSYCTVLSPDQLYYVGW